MPLPVQPKVSSLKAGAQPAQKPDLALGRAGMVKPVPVEPADMPNARYTKPIQTIGVRG